MFQFGWCGKATPPSFCTVSNICSMLLTGRPTYPLERTLLTTGLTAAGVDSLWEGQKRVETPHLSIAYEPAEEPTFWRN